MRQSDVIPTHRLRVIASVLVVIFTGTLGCQRQVDQFALTEEQAAFLDDSAAANASCRPPTDANTRAGFVSWASRLRYMHIPWKARPRGFTPPSGESLFVEITSAARGRRELAEGCVIGRIVSTYRDSAFGMIDGITYIWADSSSPNSVHLVPEDGTSEMIGYNLATEPYVSGDEPTITAGTPSKHICEQCGRNDWCVYPRDGFRVEEPASPDVSLTTDPG